MDRKQYRIETSHGSINVHESTGTGKPILMIHGTSSSAAVFRHQLNGEIGTTWRVVAPDLPGHGMPSNANEPERTYCMEGYADALLEVLQIIGIQEAVVFGWSLGGHIGLEMISRFPGMLGLMITGTPPISPEEVGQGFKANEHMHLVSKENFTLEDVDVFALNSCGVPRDPLLTEAVRRADGRARRIMYERFVAGTCGNQRKIIAEAVLPIAVVNGIDEPFVDISFVARMDYRNLWEGRTHVIEGSGHAPFWENPELFDAHLSRFVIDVSKS